MAAAVTELSSAALRDRSPGRSLDRRPAPPTLAHPAVGIVRPLAVRPRTVSRRLAAPAAAAVRSGPQVAAVILSMGTRPTELAVALESLLAQEGVDLDVVVVGNGWEPTGLPPQVRTVHSRTNVGVPEGRNIGARAAEGELIFFFDDDAVLPTTDVLARLTATMLEDERLAVVQPRAADPDGRPSPRRWVPRLDVRHGGRGGEVPLFWEGVCVIRRSAFDQVGGWPGQFFYAHEGIDLAWRLVDAGWRLWYDPTVEVHHPATNPARHAVYYRMTARNRVWVAARNLPVPLIPVYLAIWVLATVVRLRRPSLLRPWFAGLVEGIRTPCPGRNPMSLRTVLRLTLAGRPPIV